MKLGKFLRGLLSTAILVLIGAVVLGFTGPSASPPDDTAAVLRIDTDNNLSISAIPGSGILRKIVNVKDPTANSDVSTKAYVDAQVGGSCVVGDSLTANIGLYNNKIPTGSFTNAFTEICFKSGSTQKDIHSAGESTSGGLCGPGDVGYIIERTTHALTTWELAKETCLLTDYEDGGMRLPEPFEWKLACRRKTTYSITQTTREWASNFAEMDGSNVSTAAMGDGGDCGKGGSGGVAGGPESSLPFRCVR